MKYLSKFDSILKKLCENDDFTFGNWCMKCIMVVLGTMTLPLCIIPVPVGFMAPLMLLHFAAYAHTRTQLYIPAETGVVSIYVALQHTPLRKEDFIKARTTSLISFVSKLAIAGGVLGGLFLLIPENRNFEYLLRFVISWILIFAIVILVNISYIHYSTKNLRTFN